MPNPVPNVLAKKKDPGYSRISDAVVLTNKITSDVRGAFPELLLANMLTNQGYTKVLNRIRPKILEATKGELDTLGILIENDSILKLTIFESKGQANDDIELQEEINRFSDNIKIIRNNLPALCNELSIPPSQDAKIEAIFVSMDRLQQKNELTGLHPFLAEEINLNVPENIILWDIDELVSRLKRSKVHRDYLALLKRVPVAVVIDPFVERKPIRGTLAPSEPTFTNVNDFIQTDPVQKKGS